jgi:hypothetical protein
MSSKPGSPTRKPQQSAPQHDSGPEAASGTIPEPVERLIALFERELSGVEFPEVSVGALAQAVTEVQAAARHCESLRAELAAAEGALESSRNALVRLAERGRAYAKVYAAEDAALTATLEGIRFGGARPERGKVTRKRRTAASESGTSEGVAASSSESAESAWSN